MLKKLVISSFLLALTSLANVSFASHGAWPPPPESSSSGTLNFSPSSSYPDVFTVQLTESQVWSFFTPLMDATYGAIAPGYDSVQSLPGQEIFANPWLIHDFVAFPEGLHIYNGHIIDVPEHHLGMYYLIDMLGSPDHPIVNIWDLQGVGTGSTALLATDSDYDGFPGQRQLFGSLAGTTTFMEFYTTVPVPAAVWLFASGLVALLGIRRQAA